MCIVVMMGIFVFVMKRESNVSFTQSVTLQQGLNYTEAGVSYDKASGKYVKVIARLSGSGGDSVTIQSVDSLKEVPALIADGYNYQVGHRVAFKLDKDITGYSKVGKTTQWGTTFTNGAGKFNIYFTAVDNSKGNTGKLYALSTSSKVVFDGQDGDVYHRTKSGSKFKFNNVFGKKRIEAITPSAIRGAHGNDYVTFSNIPNMNVPADNWRAFQQLAISEIKDGVAVRSGLKHKIVHVIYSGSQDWEIVKNTGRLADNHYLLEGQKFVQIGSQINLYYSGNASFSSQYTTGHLTFIGGDITSSHNWLYAGKDTIASEMVASGLYGVGAVSYTDISSKHDGSRWLMTYHASKDGKSIWGSKRNYFAVVNVDRATGALNIQSRVLAERVIKNKVLTLE